MKSIVVATDFSKGSINAIKYAIDFANTVNANITLLWVNKMFFDVELPVERIVKAEEAKKTLECLVEKYKKNLKKDLSIDYKIREGKVYKEIINQAKYTDASLIIMGTHGVSGFEEMWIGSNAYKVVAASDCPVISIRYDTHKPYIKKIVMPLDTTKETLYKVPFTIKMAKYFNAEIHLIACNTTKLKDMKDKTDKTANKVIELLKKNNINYTKTSIQNSNIANAVIEYAKNVEADIIAITTEENGPIFSFIIGSTAQSIINHSPIPVLSIRVNDPNKLKELKI